LKEFYQVRISERSLISERGRESLIAVGNRSALEWILDQYKEKKPKDPTIREKFNTYRFADYKDKVIDLLMRVTTVSVRTVAIANLMKNAGR
jgi:predicted helicase